MTASCGSSKTSADEKTVEVEAESPAVRDSVVGVFRLTGMIPMVKPESADTVATRADKTLFEVCGTVVDDRGYPMVRASVLEKNTTNGVVTDENGRFRLMVSGMSPLVVSFIGCMAQEIAVHQGMDSLKVVMNPDRLVMGEMPVIDQSADKGEAPLVRPETMALPEDSAVEERMFGMVEETYPEFPGGMAECLKYIEKKTAEVFPADSLSAKSVQGRFIVQFTIDEKGKVVNPVVIRSPYPAWDKYALKIVSDMPDWKPGRQRGKNVPVKYTVPITLK